MQNIISSNSGSLTMSSIEIVESLISGCATEDHARKIALDLVSILLGSITSCADSIGESERSVRLEQLDAAAEIRSIVLGSVYLFNDHHPWCAKVISDALRVSAYAEGVLIPIAMRVSDERGQGSVFTYIVKNSVSGLLKIGRSSNPYQRIKALETGSGHKLDLRALINGDVELDLHHRFESLRVFGEWFRDDGRIAEFIASEVKS